MPGEAERILVPVHQLCAWTSPLTSLRLFSCLLVVLARNVESCLVFSASSAPTLSFQLPPAVSMCVPDPSVSLPLAATPPSLPCPLSPPFTSFFVSLCPVLLCISRNLAFLRSILHRYPVTLSIKSSLVTIPFQTLKYSVYVSFHTSCPFSLYPGIGTRQAIYFCCSHRSLYICFFCPCGSCPQPSASSSSAGP